MISYMNLMKVLSALLYINLVYFSGVLFIKLFCNSKKESFIQLIKTRYGMRFITLFMLLIAVPVVPDLIFCYGLVISYAILMTIITMIEW